MLRNQKVYRSSEGNSLILTTEGDMEQEMANEPEKVQDELVERETDSEERSQIEPQNISENETILNSQVTNVGLNMREIQALFLNFQDRLRDDMINSEGRLRQHIKEEMNSSENRLRGEMASSESRLKENIGILQSNVESMEGRIGTNLTALKADIKGEIGRIDSNVNEVRNSVAEIKTQMEASLDKCKVDLVIQMNSQVESLRTELNQGVENASTVVHSQVNAVNAEIISIKEQILNIQNLAQTSENGSRNRFVDLEREILKLHESNVISNEKLRTVEREVNLLNQGRRETITSAGNETSTPGEHGDTVSRPSTSKDQNDGQVVILPEVIIGNVNSSSNTDSVNATRPILNDVTIPTFSNKANQNPVRFLNELESYFQLKSIHERHKMTVVRNALTGSVQAWVTLMLSSDITYAAFKRKFLSYFWGTQKQDELRNKLMNGKFNPRGKLGPEEYFLELAKLLFS